MPPWSYASDGLHYAFHIWVCSWMNIHKQNRKLVSTGGASLAHQKHIQAPD